MILGRMAVPFKRIKISIVVKLSALVAGSVVVTALAVNEVYRARKRIWPRSVI